MDRLTKGRRSALMSKVRSKDTKIELILRNALWARGVRYRKHLRNLPGKPDLAITKLKIAIFVDSEFWHGHNWSKQRQALGTNREFWITKIERNMERDLQVNAQLKELGWTVIRIWGRRIQKHLDECVEEILTAIDQKESCGKPGDK